MPNPATVEVRLIPYPGAEERWVKAEVFSGPDKDGGIGVRFLDGFTYHGSTALMAKKGDWREMSGSP